MNYFIVTVKLPKDPDHNPKNKITDKCLFSDVCTDVTGEHHSFFVITEMSVIELRSYLEARGHHVTRIESTDFTIRI